MITQLREAFERAGKLPEAKQVSLAWALEGELDILESEEREVEIRPGGELDMLIQRAKEDERNGLTIPLEELLDELDNESRVPKAAPRPSPASTPSRS